MLKPLNKIASWCKASSLKILRSDVLTQSLCLVDIDCTLRPRNLKIVVQCK
jgi:hypothetical protein